MIFSFADCYSTVKRISKLYYLLDIHIIIKASWKNINSIFYAYLYS